MLAAVAQDDDALEHAHHFETELHKYEGDSERTKKIIEVEKRVTREVERVIEVPGEEVVREVIDEVIIEKEIVVKRNIITRIVFFVFEESSLYSWKQIRYPFGR